MTYADADEQLSPNMARTAEGFLIAKDAVVARTGEQEYFGTEVPTVQPDSNGWVIVNRPEREVFNPRSLASYTGKPVVLTHPDDVVSTDNVRRLQIGSVLSARRGEGEYRDCVTADLIFTDRNAIELVRRGTHRSLSAGYDANYIPRGPGRADQCDIRINHVALLPTGEARCGPRCAVRDRRPQPPPRPVVTAAVREQRRAHEAWSRDRMHAIAEAQRRFWQRPTP